MKIGILGGTFNPIHIGHIYIAEECCRRLELQKVILVPTYIPPHKSAKDLVRAEQRLEMCRLAAENHTSFEVCDYEICNNDRSYTYRTLEFLHGKYQEGNFYLIMGEDMFLTVQDWRKPHKIYEMAALCAAKREDGSDLQLKSQALRLENEGARCIILDMKPLTLSSTTIRDGLKQGKDVSGLLDQQVLEYIGKNGLYGRT
ncbi:MAG: nicotinate-nucleotide adenylyltransferase [Oscillospiraceae bacterium]|nr:nicotinate-nucleotide adenylyltransferase [Oscillospiraceae bacterium]